MRRRTLGEALLLRHGKDDRDRGSIPMLMLVMIATAALGGILLSIVIGQSRTSRFDESRLYALNAARAGVDVVLGQFRAATATDPTTDSVNGDSGKLPCGPLTGSVAGQRSERYAATITYYYRRPLTTSNAMVCTGAGPFYSSLGKRTPHFAVITAIGCNGALNSAGTACATASGGSAGRTIQTTYVFETNDANISGGTIMIYPSGTTGSTYYCMDAGSNPAPGSAVTLEPCSTSVPPIAQQLWAYRQDLSIELVSTANTDTPLCIDTAANPAAHAPGPMLLEACYVSDSTTWCGLNTTPQQYATAHPGQTCTVSPMCPAGTTPTQYAAHPPNAGETCSVSPWHQQWSVDDNAHLRGAKTDQSNTDGYCINVPAQAADVALTLASCAGGVTDPNQTWVPSPTTGAGMAGASDQQLVNFQMFATCMDVTQQKVTASFMILYTCKQNPNPAKVLWNQKFIPSPALGVGPTQTLITVVTGGNTYCLKSPMTRGGYPVLGPAGGCPASVGAASGTGYLWTVNQRYDASGTTELPYASRYTIRDATPNTNGGLCLSVSPNSDIWNQYQKAIVTTCDGSTLQKWNASPSLAGASLTDTHETGAPGS